MRIALFCHSILSDWNHGNAHFLRGVVRELLERGHRVTVHEPSGGWSVSNLLADEGPQAVDEVRRSFPWLAPERYELPDLLRGGLEELVDGTDLVLVHEWTAPELVSALGRLRQRGGDFLLLFHDTHHRSVSDPEAMEALDLSGYDGVLAFGEVVRMRYLERGWAPRAWTWHEAADTRLFRPSPHPTERDGEVVWIGNWGDEERTAELTEFLLEPIRRLGVRGTVHGVRYPPEARAAVQRAGGRFAGRVPNHRVPEVLARHLVTVHVPRRPYIGILPGVPTIRPFEAMACGIPLVSSPWQDVEGLFRRGVDHLVAEDGRAMEGHLRDLIHDPELRRDLAREGLRTVQERHTCAHRVDELLAIVAELGADPRPAVGPASAANAREATA
ncbi:MAG: glycosyltransferase [Thermoanaerobaculia bacterium]